MAGRNYVQWEMDVSRARARLLKIKQEMKQESANAAHLIADKGKNYARTIAPYWHGDTFRNIRLLRPSGDEAIIQARNPTASRADGFNLVRWMHESPRARQHITSGDPHFMFTTRQMLSEEAPRIVEARFNKIVLRNN